LTPLTPWPIALPTLRGGPPPASGPRPPDAWPVATQITPTPPPPSQSSPRTLYLTPPRPAAARLCRWNNLHRAALRAAAIFPCGPPIAAGDPGVDIGWENAPQFLKPRSVQSLPPLIDLPQSLRPESNFIPPVPSKRKTSGGISMCFCSATLPSRCSDPGLPRTDTTASKTLPARSSCSSECLPPDLDCGTTGCHVVQLSQVSNPFDPELRFLS
jgi:hypothetical protein